ncbi:uncharacterized protein LOC143280256 [Babylonia areolata]|uniref:uncharacterized protein LOC143280256 n=1 Tax=Babylonia areolata TaxID=304850 RepID=UPI003FD3CCCF
MTSMAVYLLITSQMLLMTSLRAAVAFDCSLDNNAMSPEDPFVFYGQILRLCCNVTGAAERDVTHPDDVIFYRLDVPLTGGNVTWGSAAKGEVCWQGVLEEEEGREGGGGGREAHNEFSLQGTFYYCRLKPGGSGNDTHNHTHGNNTHTHTHAHAHHRHGPCLGFQSVQTDRSLWTEVQKDSVWCVTELGKMHCDWRDITPRFLHPHRVSSPRLLYGFPRADKDCQDVRCDGTRCVCSLQQGTDFQLNSHFSLQMSVLWHYLLDDSYGPPVPVPPAFLNVTVRPWTRVKAPAPRGLNVTSPHPHCVRLTWQGEGGGEGKGESLEDSGGGRGEGGKRGGGGGGGGTPTSFYIYRLTVEDGEGQRRSTPEDEEFMEDNSFPDLSREVCGLSPFTAYTVSLKRRANHSHVWSDVIHSTVRTRMAPPDRSPEVAPGYLLGSNKEVTVFWQAIPESSANGPRVGYKVKVTMNSSGRGSRRSEEGEGGGEGGTTGPVVVSASVTNATSLTFPSLLLSSSPTTSSSSASPNLLPELQVLALNDAGPTASATVLALDPWRDGAKNVRAIVERVAHEEMTVNITWLPEPSRDHSYTVLWCLSGGHNTSFPCRDDLVQWRTVAPSSTSFMSHEVPAEWAGRVMFGVSLSQPTAQPPTASGFRLSPCLYHRHTDGTLRVLYASGCEDSPVTYVVSGQVPSLVIGVSVPMGLLCIVICVTAVRRRYRYRKEKFSSNFQQTAFAYRGESGRELLSTSYTSSPSAAQNGRPEVRNCAGQEEETTRGARGSWWRGRGSRSGGDNQYHHHHHHHHHQHPPPSVTDALDTASMLPPSYARLYSHQKTAGQSLATATPTPTPNPTPTPPHPTTSSQTDPRSPSSEEELPMPFTSSSSSVEDALELLNAVLDLSAVEEEEAEAEEEEEETETTQVFPRGQRDSITHHRYVRCAVGSDELLADSNPANTSRGRDSTDDGAGVAGSPGVVTEGETCRLLRSGADDAGDGGDDDGGDDSDSCSSEPEPESRRWWSSPGPSSGCVAGGGGGIEQHQAGTTARGETGQSPLSSFTGTYVGWKQ